MKEFNTYPPMKMEQSVPKRRHIKFRHRGITQKKHTTKRKKINDHIRTFILGPCTGIFTCSVNSCKCIASVVDEGYMSMEN